MLFRAVSTVVLSLTLTISEPIPISTGIYPIFLTGTGNSEAENMSLTISVLNANVTVSGNITLVGYDGFEEKGLSQIKFIDVQTNETVAFVFPYVYPSIVTEHTVLS